MKYTEDQLKEKILQIVNSAEAGDAWQEEVFALLKSQIGADWSGELVDDKTTKADILLFGKAEAMQALDGFVPCITWMRCDESGDVAAQKNFGMPLAQTIDKLSSKIKIATYTYETEQISLFPDEAEQYDRNVIKGILSNCIAHANYQMQSSIMVKEFPDKLEFVCEGTFLPKLLQAEQNGEEIVYKNAALCRAMTELGLLDGSTTGFFKVNQLQSEKGLPLPTYDIETTNQIRITLYGKVLDKNYRKLLKSRKDLDLRTIFLLDKVQKQEEISYDDYLTLKKKGLTEGRYPNIYVSYKVAGATGLKTDYVKNKGLSDDVYKKVLINALKTMGSANVRELFGVLKGALPEVMDKKQQSRKISNLLQSLKKQGVVKSKGTGQSARWYLVK